MARWLLFAFPSLLLAGMPATGAHAQGTGLSTGWSVERCRATGADRDADGLDDACEHALAAAFAPELIVDARDCLLDGAAGPPRLRGAYLYLVERRDARLLLAYLPGYLRDCGWTGIQRLLRLGRRNAHDGDSELVVIEVEPLGGDAWRTTGIFLSAHCGGRSDGRCRWFRGTALERFAWHASRPLGAPRVWVSRDKHAHYPSRGDCESGHWLQERCGRQGIADRFPVLDVAQNIGSRKHPLPRVRGCFAGSELTIRPAGVSREAVECIWDDSRPFGGWQRERRGRTTPYARVLRDASGL